MHGAAKGEELARPSKGAGTAEARKPMLLKEAAPPASNPIPLAEFSAHLRLGFTDDGSEDALLDLYLRHAVAVVEVRTGQALMTRPYLLQIAGWNRRGHLVLPLGPVAAVDRIRFVRAGGVVDMVPAEWALEPGRTRQRLTGHGGGALRPVPHGALAELEFTAGHAADWAEVPGDLRQAVLMLAAHYYENRHGELGEEAALPPAVGAILAPHRPARL
jgi:uncharacterized phiE125 gp8 family phage protein